MKRLGCIPERCHTEPPVKQNAVAKVIGRRYQIHDTCWASGYCKEGKRWESCESQVFAGATGTLSTSSDETVYIMAWDPQPDLRLGYTTMGQATLDRLIDTRVLTELKD